MEAYYLAHKVHRTESRKTEIQKCTNTQRVHVHSSKKSDQTNNMLEKQRKGLILKTSTQNMFQHSY